MISKIIVVSAILVAAGQDRGVRCFEGGENYYLKKAARTHAAYMAHHKRQGHQGWDQRKSACERRLRYPYRLNEVCAESWPGATKAEAATQMYEAWYATRIYEGKGHWGAINRPAKIYGFAMARGTNGVWYACGIIGR